MWKPLFFSENGRAVKVDEVGWTIPYIIFWHYSNKRRVSKSPLMWEALPQSTVSLWSRYSLLQFLSSMHPQGSKERPDHVAQGHLLHLHHPLTLFCNSALCLSSPWHLFSASLILSASNYDVRTMRGGIGFFHHYIRCV